MAGNHFSVVVSLLSLALAALAGANPILFKAAPYSVGVALLIWAALAVIFALLVLLHGVGRAPGVVSTLLDQWLGVENSSVVPDMPLVDILRIYCPNVVARQDNKKTEVPEGEYQRCSDVMDQLREYAAQDRLKVWGRETSEHDYRRDNPRLAIAPSFWIQNSINYLRFTETPLGKTEPSISGSKKYYCDLYFSKRQVRRLFKSPSKLVFQKPWRRA